MIHFFLDILSKVPLGKLVLKMCMSFFINLLTSFLFCSLSVGPQNTIITASPGSSPMEGDHLKLTCVTESNPPPQIIWRKHLADESIQHLVENNVLSIPHVRSTDSGLYICEVINLVTNKTEKATVDIVVQGTSLLEFNFCYPVPNWQLPVGLEDAVTLKIRKLWPLPCYVFMI